jgi:mannose-1-phosphate guanylyltransferase/mannose-1-phosphate guanylyltransferase/mannose-6-phosphate isomerase
LIYPVILSGGSGTRLWPLSRSLYPKQLIPLLSENSLLQETALRVPESAGFGPPLVICNAEHRFVIAEQLRSAGSEPQAIVLEPVGRNTAPAVACAALLLQRTAPDALMLVLPSDHLIKSVDGFHDAVAKAAAAAKDGALVTFGIEPERPETGYGYIRGGAPYEGGNGPVDGCRAVEAFVEKPDRARAESYLAEGGYYWNSGMFLFSADIFLRELERFEPAILTQCRAAVEAGQEDLDFLRLDSASFEASPSISIDYAVMERTEHAAVVPASMGWSDVGSWSALWETGEKDVNGNVHGGDVIVRDTSQSYLRSEGPLLCAVGVEGLVVVATEDVVLVVDRDRAQDIGALVRDMAETGRQEPHANLDVHRPWGSYRSIRVGERFQAKHIIVRPGGCLSLQKHHQRAEHWVVVRGRGHVVRGDDEFVLEANESTYIPRETVHRLENRETEPLELIEVQTGDYLGEDDIVRLEDVYGRG